MLAPEPAPPTIPGPVRPLSHFQPQTPSARRPTVPHHVRHTDAATAAGGTTTAARWEPRGTRGTHATSRLAHGAPGHPSPGPSYPRGADLTIAPRLSARHRSSISAGPLHDSSATPRPAGPARGQRRRSIIGARSQDHPLTPTTANAGLRPRYRFVRPPGHETSCHQPLLPAPRPKHPIDLFADWSGVPAHRDARLLEKIGRPRSSDRHALTKEPPSRYCLVSRETLLL